MAVAARVERWELDLAIAAAVDSHRDGAPVGTDLVCDMHGILDDADRIIVRDLAALRLGLPSGLEVAA